MKGELVSFLTKDGLVLYGFLAPAKSKKAIIYIHGLTGNFYRAYKSNMIEDLAQACQRNEINFLSINTRGSEIIADFKKKVGNKFKTVTIGTAYERFEDCVHDIKAAIDFLSKKGIKEFYLAGKSTGCQKSTYYLMKTIDRRVKGLILIAPADDKNFQHKFLKSKYDKALRLCERLIKSGRKFELMPKWSYEFIASAYRYHSIVKRVEGTIFDYTQMTLESIKQIKVPILAIFGSREEFAAIPPKKMLAIIERSAINSPKCGTLLVKGADHSFVGHIDYVVNKIISWVRDL